MHIAAHIVAGLSLFALTGEPLAFIGSLAPDLALLPNELTGRRYNKWNIKMIWAYRFTHSLIFPLLGMILGWQFALGILIHILMDIPFHTSALRWAPLGFNRYKEGKKALLLSGGADSIACAMTERSFDCVFFEYGQGYAAQERPHAEAMATALGKPLIVIRKQWRTDIPSRNFYMVMELAQKGYTEIIVGTRNLTPLGDRHGDSNWLVMKVLQTLLGIYINMPVVGLFKWQVKRRAQGYTYYSTEA